MDLVIRADGTIQLIYSEALPLASLGAISIRRASHVEPTPNGQWQADLSPVNGPVLGPFDLRTDALAVELKWLNENWLTPVP